MKIAFYGSSLVSSYWNGAATYYRGIIRDLARRGYDITFYEPDAYERQSHRDIEPPEWCRVIVYPATIDAMKDVVRALNPRTTLHVPRTPTPSSRRVASACSITNCSKA